MTTPTVKFRKVHTDAKLPVYATPGAAGADICAVLDDGAPYISLDPGARTLVMTGLEVEIPEGFEIQVRPRSGLAFKSGVTVLNSPGTIDSDYRGELGVILYNADCEDFIIKPGDRIAQIVVAPVVQAGFEWTEELSETERGAGGFGSTGVAEVAA
jgi:dUTP pyrophosphatase